jgi:putrescine importer
MMSDRGSLQTKARTDSVAASLHLRRVLNLRDLLIYGMIIVQVLSPVPIFGLLDERSNGNSVGSALIAMIPMLLTAISYGRLAVVFPVAGSSYSYVSRALNPHLGFLIGWAIFLDYLMNQVICAIIPALAIQRLLPAAPLPLLTFLVLVCMTGVNLFGIRVTLRANTWLLILASAAVLLFLGLAIRYLSLSNGGFSKAFALAPIYDPAVFRARDLLAGVSLAALTYIGFDGLTTLAEDAINPKRDMVRATVLIVIFTGLLSALELYFLHSVLPDWRSADPNTSYLDVMLKIGGAALFSSFLVIMSLSQFAAGLSIQVGAARLLYGMGRDGVLPRSAFGYIDPRRHHPSRNIVFMGVLAFLGTVAISFDHALDLLNFGAFLAYIAVNAAAMWTFGMRPSPEHKRRVVSDLLFPAAGLVGCLIFWFGLPERAKIVGGLWLLVGFGYCAYRTRGFRQSIALDL